MTYFFKLSAYSYSFSVKLRPSSARDPYFPAVMTM
jgi:hypothetical protein